MVATDITVLWESPSPWSIYIICIMFISYALIIVGHGLNKEFLISDFIKLYEQHKVINQRTAKIASVSKTWRQQFTMFLDRFHMSRPD